MTVRLPRIPSRRFEIGLAVLFALFALAGLASRTPVGPPSHEQGQVTSIERNWRNGLYAVFTAADGTPNRHVPLETRTHCKAGDVIRVIHRPRLIGSGYVIADPQPCVTPPSVTETVTYMSANITPWEDFS